METKLRKRLQKWLISINNLILDKRLENDLWFNTVWDSYKIGCTHKTVSPVTTTISNGFAVKDHICSDCGKIVGLTIREAKALDIVKFAIDEYDREK